MCSTKCHVSRMPPPPRTTKCFLTTRIFCVSFPGDDLKTLHRFLLLVSSFNGYVDSADLSTPVPIFQSKTPQSISTLFLFWNPYRGVGPKRPRLGPKCSKRPGSYYYFAWDLRASIGGCGPGAQSPRIKKSRAINCSRLSPNSLVQNFFNREIFSS